MDGGPDRHKHPPAPHAEPPAQGAARDPALAPRPDTLRPVRLARRGLGGRPKRRVSSPAPSPHLNPARSATAAPRRTGTRAPPVDGSAGRRPVRRSAAGVRVRYPRGGVSAQGRRRPDEKRAPRDGPATPMTACVAAFIPGNVATPARRRRYRLPAPCPPLCREDRTALASSKLQFTVHGSLGRAFSRVRRSVGTARQGRCRPLGDK